MPLLQFKPGYDPSRSVGSKEKVFLEQYDWLLKAALTFTRGSRSRAEDLVHDLFVQFQVKVKSMDEVADHRGYLYGMLRNIYASQLRHAARHSIHQLSILDHDSAALGLRARDFSDRLETLSVLTQACEFACHRKETTLTASIFILRYFHGYYRDEIALLLGVPTKTIDVWLSRGRAETKKYLADPYPIPQSNASQSHPRPKANGAHGLLAQLRAIIFASCATPCAPIRRAQKSSPLSLRTPAPTTEELAHLVSCPACLNRRSRQHGLPGLKERLFDETDQRGDGGEPPSNGSAGAGSSLLPSSKKQRAGKLRQGYSRTRELLEHRPAELSIAVDGQVRTSYVISSGVTLLNLTVDSKEQAEFVEILSEQDVRFLLLDKDDLATVAPRRYDIALSDRRVLEVEILPDVPGPCIQVSYRDPSLEPAPAVAGETDRKELFAGYPRMTLWLALRSWFLGLSDTWRIFAALATTACLALLATLIFWSRSERKLLPEDVLQRVIRQEQSLPVNAAAHSLYQYEEEDSAGRVEQSGEVDVWRQSVPRRLAVRLYDAQHTLVRGFVEDLRGQAEYGKAKPRRSESDTALAWRDVPSAQHFASLLGSGVVPEITQARDQYRLEVRAPRSRLEVVDAVLVIDRRSMRAVEADYDIRDAQGDHHVRLKEATYELYSADGFDHGVFDVGRDFDTPSGHSRVTAKPLDNNTPNTASLELQVLTDLMQAGASAGEQIDVHRDRQSGIVEVHGVVETPERRAALLQALAPMQRDPHLKVSLRSVNELAKSTSEKPSRGKRHTAPPTAETPLVLDSFQSTNSSVPADAAIRAHLQITGLSGRQLDDAVHAYATQACAQSLQAQQHAYRLAQLAAEFTSADLAQFDSSSRLKWLMLVANDSEALDGDLRSLRIHLQPVFGEAIASSAAADSPSSSSPLTTPDELASASRNMLATTTRLNQQIQSAFLVSAVHPDASPDLQPAGDGAFPEIAQLLNAAESMAGNVSATAQHLQLFATNAK